MCRNLRTTSLGQNILVLFFKKCVFGVFLELFLTVVVLTSAVSYTVGSGATVPQCHSATVPQCHSVRVFHYYSQVQNIRGKGVYFFVIFGDPRSLFWPPPPFINFSNFSRGYIEVHKYIIDSWRFISVLKRLRNIIEIPMLSEVNKVSKIILFSSLSFFYILPPPLILIPPFNNFSKSLKPPPPVYFDPPPPPFIMNLRVSAFIEITRFF